MLTVLLAWVNSKYDKDYALLFIGTFILDLELLQNLFPLFFK